MATLPEQLERLEAAVTARGRDRCTGRATPPRRTRSSRGIARGARRRRGDQGQVARHRRDRAQRGARAGGHRGDRDRPRRADRAARAATRRRTSSSRRSTATAPRSRRCSSARSRGGEQLGVGAARAIAEAARAHLREKFLSVPVGGQRARTSAIAETGTICVVESEGNGRMCTTLPEVLVTVMGIEKVLPEWRDLEVMLQLLPRSSTGERMNPYTSIWTGRARRRRAARVPPRAARQRAHRRAGRRGRAPGAALHPLLGLPERRARSTRAPAGTRTSRSIPGPIGAILTPQLQGLDERADAAVGLVAVRRVLRGLPGQDRHPDRARAPARPGRARGAVRAGARERLAMDGAGARVRVAARATSARSGWPRLGRGPLARCRSRPLSAWTRDARAARACPSRRSASGGRER